jgi:hypothetical protein
VRTLGASASSGLVADRNQLSRRTERLCRHDESLGGAAFVTMMQSSDLWERDDLARSRSVYWPGVRTILVEREMRSGLVIIMKIR